MKRFFWKLVLCAIPCLLALAVTVIALNNYMQGEQGRFNFKLGPDLAGGTILVYEIDLRKSQEGGKGFDTSKTADIEVLADALKKRIDPNDLYNIIIRPAAGEGRVEIILPTGGTYRARKADEAWKKVLDDMQKVPEFKLVQKIEVGRGKILELADRIHQTVVEKVWQEKLFGDKDGWDKLRWAAVDKWADLEAKEQAETLPGFVASTVGLLGDPLSQGPFLAAFALKGEKRKLPRQLDAIKVADLNTLENYLLKELQNAEPPQNAKTIKAWIKEQAWTELLARAQIAWPELRLFKQDIEDIQPDHAEQLAGFIQARGNVVIQAGVAVLEPYFGRESLSGMSTRKKVEAKGDKKEEVDKAFPSYQEALDWVEKTYGQSLEKITDLITKRNEATGHSKDLSVEEVQRIKDLVSKVGSLEFRILANYTDDKEASDLVMEQLNPKKAETMKVELDKARENGLPPPGPRDPNTNEPKKFKILLGKNRDQESWVTYSWVELGPQERRQLNLDNAAKTEYDRNRAWHEMAGRREQAIPLTETGTLERKLFQGALFYSRVCQDRNLPEEERRKKQIEYFVLARDPEWVKDPKSPLVFKQTPKIDGNYLTSAMSGYDNGLRPAVHFAFNNEGASLFGDLTGKSIPAGTGPDELKRHLAIILDGLVMSAPTINSRIDYRGQISGSFTQKEVDALVNILRAGRLPATLKPKPVSETTIGVLLGEDTVAKGVRAVGLAFLAVLAFMIFYYRFAGLVASTALLANLLLTVGFMVAVQATFTLPGLAGLVLMLGMAVDANVLIYERFREERERGMNLHMAIRQGYERALPTIIDTHLSSIFTAIVLYVVGNDQLKGFGISLTVGLLISLFTSLYMTHVIFDFWLAKGWLKKLSMLRLFARPDFDFMGLRRIMFTITVVVSLLGVALFIGRLPHDLNIDFRGGTEYSGQTKIPLDIGDIRTMLDEQNQHKLLKVKQVEEDKDSGGRKFYVHYENPASYEKPEEKIEVNLSNVPAGKDAQEREKAVADRASQLPDPSVILYFLQQDETSEGNKTRHFNVRTTEMEVELVQANIYRLLRDDKGESLLRPLYMNIDPLQGRESKLHFKTDDPDPAKKERVDALASPLFVKSLFQHNLSKVFKETDKTKLPQYTMDGEGLGTDDRYSVFALKFEKVLTAEEIEKINLALRETREQFGNRPPTDGLQNFDAQLATATRYRALWAVLASWGAILLYLWFRFGSWTFGLAAVLCLIHDLFFTLGAIAACHYVHGTFIGNLLGIEDFKIDLAAVAALLTLVGYSVNDTIVVFDRIREVRGKNPRLTPQMINDSINQTLSRTILASLTTWLVVFVLYVWGGPGVKLFGFVMVVGVIVGTYSSIYIASPLLLIFREGETAEDKAAEQRRAAALAQSANA